MSPEQETPETGIRARLFGWMKHRQIVMELDVAQAHEVNRYEFVRRIVVLDYLVEKYEKTMISYTRLRTMLTSLVARKQRDVLLNALQVFEDAITITDVERQMLRETIKKDEEELQKVGVEEIVQTTT